MKSAVRSKYAGLFWVSPWLVGLCVFFLFPMGLGAYYSLTDYTMLEPPVWVGGKTTSRSWVTQSSTARCSTRSSTQES